jgi:hypothetical protein
MVLTYKQKFNKKYGFKKDEGHSLKEIAQITGYKLRGLKTIFERGEGAFYNNPESVRKSVSNPQQWAYARVYAAVNPESKAHQIDKMFLIKKNNDNK